MPPHSFPLSPVMIEILEVSDGPLSRESMRELIEPRGKMAAEFDRAHCKLWQSGLLEIVPAHGKNRPELPFMYKITGLGQKRLAKAKEPA